MTTEIIEGIAKNILDLCDRGLVKGVGKPIPGEMCVEAVICFALGLPHGDNPDQCVTQSLRTLKIRLNDFNWSSNAARAKGLRRLALAQLGSAGVLDEKEFVRRIAVLAIQKSVPEALRAVAKVQSDEKYKAALLNIAMLCEKEPTQANALAARYATGQIAAAASTAAAAAYAAAIAASTVEAYDAADAAASIAASTAAASTAAAYAAYAATSTAAAAAYAAAYAAYAASTAAAAAADAASRDKSLASFCEAVVQILIDMKAPGCQWLSLTEDVKS